MKKAICMVIVILILTTGLVGCKNRQNKDSSSNISSINSTNTNNSNDNTVSGANSNQNSNSGSQNNSKGTSSGNSNTSNTTTDTNKLTTTLNIDFLEAGYGSEWIKQLVAGFKKQQAANGRNITVNTTGAPDYGKAYAQLLAGPKNNKTDLFFACSVNIKDIISKGSSLLKGYDFVLADLSDVYSSKVNGTAIKDKMIGEFSEAYKINNKYYAFPWASGPAGIVANRNVLDKVYGANNWQYPRTTKEFADMVTKVSSTSGLKGLIWPGQVGYWQYPLSIWWAQYEGVENYNKFWQGKSYDSELKKDIYSANVFSQQGRLYSLTALQNLIGNAQNNYPGCTSTYFTTLQIYFLQDKAAFIPNGDWFENEMKDFKNINCEMIKTPVISEIVKKLPSVTGTDNEKDATLIQIIDYVDGKGSKPAGISDADIATVQNARKITYNVGFDFQALIPTYAVNIGLAKEFLKYMASDEGILIYNKYSGSFLPFNFDIKNSSQYASMTKFQKSKVELVNSNAKNITRDIYAPLYYKNNIKDFNLGVPELSLGATNAADKQTATQIFTKEFQNAQKNWNNWLSLAGITE